MRVESWEEVEIFEAVIFLVGEFLAYVTAPLARERGLNAMARTGY